MSVKVGINGFGRIGRMVFRAMMNNKDLEVVALNDLTTPETLAFLLEYDSIHGKLDAEISYTDNSIIVNGKEITVFAIHNPEEIDWAGKGAEIVIESTGLFTNRDGAAKHFQGGAKKVIISAPATDPDVTMVMGVNNDHYDPAKHNIISNASCTTNCMAPVAKVLMDNFGIEKGLMTTIHSYTGDQRLLDAPHKDLRRARAAALSLIPTSTGAAKAVGLVLPELKGKFNGISIRVPTPNVSLVDLCAVLTKKASVEEINAALKKAAEGELKGILGYTEKPLVSKDYNGCTLSSVVDGPNTYVIDDMVKVIAWYDNEYGYSNRLADLVAMIASKL